MEESQGEAGSLIGNICQFFNLHLSTIFFLQFFVLNLQKLFLSSITIPAVDVNSELISKYDFLDNIAKARQQPSPLTLTLYDTEQ